MKLKLVVISLVILTLLTGCYVPASSVYSFKSKHNNSIWMNGKQLIKLTEQNLEVIVNYDRTKQGVAIFDVAIANHSDKIIVVNPTEFYSTTTNRLNEENTVKATDPEKVILECDKQIEKNYAKHKADGQTELLFSMFEIAEAIHGRKDSEEEKDERRESNAERADNYEESAERQLNTIDRLNQERETIAHQALRKTTMFPGQKIGGKVYFKVSNKLNKLVLHLPIEERDIVLEYEILPI